MGQRQEQEWETRARALKADGYTGGVVARKLIEEHAMPEEAASRLVGELYGKKVDPRRGDTVGGVLVGAGIASVGVAGTLVLLFVSSGAPWPVWVAGFAFIGAGLSKMIIALVNAGSKEELRKTGG